MKENEQTLYGKGAYGINTWKIWSEDNVIKISANGQTYQEEIHEGKAGRTIAEQVVLRIGARVRSKLDGGFKSERSEASKPISNQLGLPAPMLATPLKSVRNIRYSGAYVQPKLDGHRMLVTSDRQAYTRRGKPITTIPEILASLKDIPEGTVIDGELYCHGQPLQRIASWAKRRQKETLKLRYHIYDIMIPGMKFEERIKLINQLDIDANWVHKVETHKYDINMSPEMYTRYYRELGFEGGILRPGAGLYEIGKRSKTLVKLKMRFDEEFLCIGIEGLSKNGEQTVLWLETKEKKPFKVTAPGSHAESKAVFEQPQKYIGRLVTCEFAEWTIDKLPFHCVAIRWRKDI